jgi:hypothetical protein
MRSKVLDAKNNNNFNVITGEDRPQIQVPYHNRYNPVLSQTGGQVIQSSASRRSATSGIVPGLA